MKDFTYSWERLKAPARKQPPTVPVAPGYARRTLRGSRRWREEDERVHAAWLAGIPATVRGVLFEDTPRLLSGKRRRDGVTGHGTSMPGEDRP